MGVFDEIKNGVSKFKQSVKGTFSNNEDKQKNSKYCSECGAKISREAKFCEKCGKDLNSTGEKGSGVAANKDSSNTDKKKDGVIFICPNCSKTISQISVICPYCGCEISEREVVSSVKEFSLLIQELERSRKERSIFSFGKADPIDKKKLSLIRSFPIPNAISDIFEFVMLAIGNISTKLSKNTLVNRLASDDVEDADTIERAISNAWVLKLRQAYQKAKILFENEKIFFQIEEVYKQKMKELKIKI